MEGVFTALITPFKRGLLDEEGLRKNIRFQIDEGVNGILALGSTGEGTALSLTEKERMVQIVLEEAKGKVLVIVNTGEIGTDQTIEKTREAEKKGADVALVITPYYIRPTQEGIYRHFKEVANTVSLPILIYHHPLRTGVHIEVRTLERLSQIENIIGLKESSGDLGFAARLLNTLPKDFSVLSGDDLLTVPLLSIGAKGVISVLSNLMPRKVCELVYNPTASLYHELFPFFHFAQCETNPIPIKAMMNRAGMAAGENRLPLCNLKEENLIKLETLFPCHV